MRKSWLASAVLVSMLGLVACGNNEVVSSSGDNDTITKVNENDKVEIKLWLNDEKYAEALIEGIENKLPHISVSFEKVAEGEASSKLELDGPAGLGGDIVFQTQESMAKSFQSTVLLPIGAELTSYVEENILDAAKQSVLSDETMYGMPVSVESLALFYNKTLLEENNLEIATSFEQMMLDANDYNDTKANKFLLRFEPWNTYTAYLFLSAAGFELFGSNGDNPDLVNLGTEAVLNGLYNFKEYQQYLPIPSKDLSWDTVHGEFVKGEVPYMINGPWAISEVKEGAENANFEWGITTLPTIDGNQPRPFLGNIVASISAYTKYPAEAREVLEYIVSNEGLEIMYNITGKLPALKDVTIIDGIVEDPYIMGINAQVQMANAMPMLGELSYFYEAADIMFQSVWDGLLTPEEAVQKALSDYQIALDITK